MGRQLRCKWPADLGSPQHLVEQVVRHQHASGEAVADDLDLLLRAALVAAQHDDAARVGGLEYAHPVFEPFRRPRSGDFTSIPVYGYRSLTAAMGAQ